MTSVTCNEEQKKIVIINNFKKRTKLNFKNFIKTIFSKIKVKYCFEQTFGILVYLLQIQFMD